MFKFKIGDRLVHGDRYEIVRTKEGWVYTWDSSIPSDEFEPTISWAGDDVVSVEIERGEYA